MRTREPTPIGDVAAFPTGEQAHAAPDGARRPAVEGRHADVTVSDCDQLRPHLQSGPLGVRGSGFRLLLVDGDVLVRRKVTEALVDASVCSVDGAEGALDAVAAGRFDAIILEVALPDGDGCDLCAAIRQRGLATPIVMLTRLGREDDAVRGLDAGANDYVVKPFRPHEFAARLRAQLRLFEASDHVQVRVGDQMFHLGRRTLSEPGQSRPVRLTVKEAAVLRYLHRANGGMVSRQELLHHVWAYSDGAETNTVATHLYRLRRKVEPRGDSPRVLVHEPGGYRLLRTGTTEATVTARERHGGRSTWPRSMSACPECSASEGRYFISLPATPLDRRGFLVARTPAGVDFMDASGVRLKTRERRSRRLAKYPEFEKYAINERLTFYSTPGLRFVFIAARHAS